MRITSGSTVKALTVTAALAVAACEQSLPLRPTEGPPPTGGGPPPGTNVTGPLSGSYELTLDIGEECSALPEAERARRYAAVLAYRGEEQYVVTLSGAKFLSGPICTAGSGRFAGIGCDQFFAAEEADSVRFSLENNNDEAHGGHIVERLSSGTWLEIIGNASGTADGSTIVATGSASLWYCSDPRGYPFPCSAFVGCSAKIRLGLTRQ